MQKVRSNAGVTRNKTSRLGYRVVTSFSISQSVDDICILQAIKDFFGCGHITAPRIKNSRKLIQEYRVVSISDCALKIVPFFESVGPLLTHKHKDFELFRRVVSMCAQKRHLTELGLNDIRSLLAEKASKKETKLASLI